MCVCVFSVWVVCDTTYHYSGGFENDDEADEPAPGTPRDPGAPGPPDVDEAQERRERHALKVQELKDKLERRRARAHMKRVAAARALVPNPPLEKKGKYMGTNVLRHLLAIITNQVARQKLWGCKNNPFRPIPEHLLRFGFYTQNVDNRFSFNLAGNHLGCSGTQQAL